MKRVLQAGWCTLEAAALLILILILSIGALLYWAPQFFEYEYQKQNVLEAVGMELPDLMTVTDEMMQYLKGAREDLSIPAVVDGVEREFFNEREKQHMKDVRGLFIGAIWIRRGLIVFLCVSFYLGWRFSLPAEIRMRAYRAVAGVVFAALAALCILISTNFTRAFTIFHQIFFQNDLWLLDPKTDLLIRIVPEPFFIDTAARIAVLFLYGLVCMFLYGHIGLRCLKKHETGR